MSLSGKILKAMSVFTGVQAVGILCSLVRAKLIAWWIGPVGTGLFAIYNSVLDMLTTAAQLNLRQSAVRDVSQASAATLPSLAGAVRWWSLRLGLVGALVMVAASPVLSIISFGDTSHWWAFAALSAALVAQSCTNGEQSIMQGTHRLRQLARVAACSAIGGTVVSIPMYYFLGELSIVPSILAFTLVGLVAAMWPPRVKSVRNSRRENIVQGRSFMRLGLFMTVSSVVTTAASYAFISYLNQSADTATTGVYQAGYTLVIRYTGIIFTALSMEFYPRLSSVCDKPRMASVVVSHEIMLILYIMAPMLVCFIAADELAVRILYESSYLDMLPFVTIGIGAMIFRAVSYAIAYVILSRGDGRRYVITEVSSALIGLALNITLYHHYGFAGLGVSYVLWYLIYCLIVGACYRGYGMRLSRSAWVVIASDIAITTVSICLKHVGWWAVLPMFIPACWLSYTGYRHIFVKKNLHDRAEIGKSLAP